MPTLNGPWGATLAAGVLLAAVGCSAAPAAAPTVNVETPPAAEVSTSPSPTESGPSRMGKTQTTKGAESTLAVTVQRVRRPFSAVIPGLPERSGFEYAAADIRMCVKAGGTAEVGWSVWTMTSKDDLVIESMGAWSDEWWNQPLYPNGHQVKVGRCVRGWMPFEVPKDSKLDLVTYAPEGMPALEWRVR
ncbi:hypothetical protein ACIBEJ_48580 [Nonomuraea sp. NPDC050790]|uniref:hypothetical protein n=1 Tax=Nonomuraea sp. NPDC050790 TaxID=3364371 RepID=UPI0037A75993